MHVVEEECACTAIDGIAHSRAQQRARCSARRRDCRNAQRYADGAGVTARVAEHAGARTLATAVVKDFVEDRVWVSACMLA